MKPVTFDMFKLRSETIGTATNIPYPYNNLIVMNSGMFEMVTQE